MQSPSGLEKSPVLESFNMDPVMQSLSGLETSPVSVTNKMPYKKYSYFLQWWEDNKTSCNFLKLRECIKEAVMKDHFNHFSVVLVGPERTRESTGLWAGELKQEQGEQVRLFVGSMRTFAIVADYHASCTCEVQ